jgi:hypothetical protein
MQTVRREESSYNPKVVKVTAESFALLLRQHRLGALTPATLLVTDAGERIVRPMAVQPVSLEC